MAKNDQVEKFVEAPVQWAETEATVAIGSGQTAALPIHIKVEEDGVALIKLLKKAGIDFEIFLRGVYQRVENGLV